MKVGFVQDNMEVTALVESRQAALVYSAVEGSTASLTCRGLRGEDKHIELHGAQEERIIFI